MNTLKHPIYQLIYELTGEIEKLGASEQITKCVTMARYDMERQADSLHTEIDMLRASNEAFVNMEQSVRNECNRLRGESATLTKERDTARAVANGQQVAPELTRDWLQAPDPGAGKYSHQAMMAEWKEQARLIDERDSTKEKIKALEEEIVALQISEVLMARAIVSLGFAGEPTELGETAVNMATTVVKGSQAKHIPAGARGAPDKFEAAFTEGLRKQIEFWMKNQDDVHNIGNAVIASLHCVLQALEDNPFST